MTSHLLKIQLSNWALTFGDLESRQLVSFFVLMHRVATGNEFNEIAGIGVPDNSFVAESSETPINEQPSGLDKSKGLSISSKTNTSPICYGLEAEIDLIKILYSQQKGPP